MKEISKNQQLAIKTIFTDYLNRYNSYNIKGKLGITQVGSLKLLRNLKEMNILASEKLANAVFYKLNLNNNYAIKLLELIFSDNDNLSSYVKGWAYDLDKFSDITNAVFLFGSILTKEKKAQDIDVCFILKNSNDYKKIQTKTDEVNIKNRLKIHTLYLTEKDFEDKLKQNDLPLIDMVKTCVVVSGVELFVKVVKNVQS